MNMHAMPIPRVDRRRASYALPPGITERRRRVLVVEDDPVQSLLITLLLEREHVSSTIARNGAEAVERVKAERFSLVLMDYLMPDVNGIEATRQIRAWEAAARREPTPIVAVTASAMSSERQRYLDVGMNEFLLKPFTAQELGDVLARHMGATFAPSLHATPWRYMP